MKRTLMQFATVAALTAGMVFAQTAAPSPNPNPPAARHQFMRRHLAQIAQKLNLSDTQQQQMKAIFQNARVTAQPIRTQLKENRQALATAAKAGQNDAQIQQLAAKRGELIGQMVTIRTEAMGKAYALLTPDQRTQADQLMQQARQNWQNRRAARQHSNG